MDVTWCCVVDYKIIIIKRLLLRLLYKVTTEYQSGLRNKSLHKKKKQSLISLNKMHLYI